MPLMAGYNQTTVTEFLLLGLPSIPGIDLFMFPFFLLLFLIILMGNLLIIILIIVDHRLHIPMYFFLANFSLVEIMMSATVVPKLIAITLSHNRTISFAGCFTQAYFYYLMGAMQFLLLEAMSLDRYVAICNPLRYFTIMSGRLCLTLLLLCWAAAFLATLLPNIFRLKLVFCGPNNINHFFCDDVGLIQLSCVDAKLLKLFVFISVCLVVLGSFIITIVTYIYIIVTILRMPSATGRGKAFSTCSAHFTVVTLGYGSAIIMYVKPIQGTSLEFNKIVSVMTIFVTPLLNPLIFSLRNENVKQALRDHVLERILHSRKTFHPKL